MNSEVAYEENGSGPSLLLWLLRSSSSLVGLFSLTNYGIFTRKSGATLGVGFATSKVFASSTQTSHVIMAGRFLEKIFKLHEIRSKSPASKEACQLYSWM